MAPAVSKWPVFGFGDVQGGNALGPMIAELGLGSPTRRSQQTYVQKLQILPTIGASIWGNYVYIYISVRKNPTKKYIITIKASILHPEVSAQDPTKGSFCVPRFQSSQLV